MITSLFRRRSPVSAQVGTDPSHDNGLRLGNMPRPSTDTQRYQSQAADQQTRIIEDITNGGLRCATCMEFIGSSDTPDQLWHCRTCHNVLHHQCVRQWFDVSGVTTLSGRSWQCPVCAGRQNNLPEPSCWCGKKPYGTIVSTDQQSGTPNSCGETCIRRIKCPHGGVGRLCSKLCHPGPCDTAPCEVACQRLRVSNAWARLQQRFKDRTRGQVTVIVLLGISLLVIYTCLGVYLVYHLEKWTKPYNYPDWFFSGNYLAEMTVGLIGFVFIMAVVACIVISLVGSVAKLFHDLLALHPTATGTKLFGTAFIIVIGAGIFALPLIGFFGGSNIVWYNQMKNSCNEFHTRVDMDLYPSRVQLFKFQTLNPSILGTDLSNTTSFHLGSHLKSIGNSKAPFFSYYRLSGKTAQTPHIAVDVDFYANKWRVMELSDTDTVNQWLAEDAKMPRKGEVSLNQLVVPFPDFKPISERQVLNGTFSDVNKNSTQMYIPELDLAITNMHGFIENYYLEPFIRVFSTIGLSDEEKSEMADSEWDNKPNERVVMRTAAFGHGRSGLSMCIRDGTMGSNAFKGLDNDMLVPFTIIAAIRNRVDGLGIRSLSEYKEPPNLKAYFRS